MMTLIGTGYSAFLVETLFVVQSFGATVLAEISLLLVENVEKTFVF